MGVEKNDIVAIDFVNSETFIWVWFGLWSIGAKPAFINYNLTGKSLVHTIETSTARLVLVDEAGRDKFSEQVLKEHGFARLQEQSYSFETDSSKVPRSIRNQTSPPRPLEPPKTEAKVQQQLQIIHFDPALRSHILTFPPTRLPDSARANQTRTSMAMLIYTSGTTGLPKPAVMSWGKASIGAKFVAGWLGLNHTDVVYTSMPLYHSSASVFGVCSTLRAGSTLSLSAKFSHKTFWPEVVASKATIVHYVGETCRYLLAVPPSPLDKSHKLRAAVGNGLRPDVWDKFKTRFGIETIYEFYGATEAPGGLFNRSSNAFSSGAIGRSGMLADMLFSSRMCIIRIDTATSPPQPMRSSDTRLCILSPQNEPGELLYRLDPADIPARFQGYFNNPTANTSKILRDVQKQGDAWYRSGDIVRKDNEGRWWWVDRAGDTFRWKAENVSTAEVADVLGKHDAVQEACVYGVAVPRHDGRAGCAAVVLKDGSGDGKTLVPTDATLKGLAEHVTKELPGFARPVWMRITRELQTTGTNKQMKSVLQSEGIEPGVVEGRGDALFWLREGRYVRFGKRDLERLEGDGVKL
jgi:acyl-CoA synthetase (AMP-forming)/AMP-acid ligase II